MTPNITPDDETGIGRWSEADFARAMQRGIRRDGAHLYPAFPYPNYTRVTRQDIADIYAYLRTLPPATNAVDRDTLPFPFNIRAAMRGWNLLFFTPGEFRPEAGRSEVYNRGAYLVEGWAIAAPATRRRTRSAPTAAATLSRAAICSPGSRPTSPAIPAAASAAGRWRRSSNT
jgi:hypothetical protein